MDTPTTARPTSSATTSKAGRSSTGRIALAIFFVFLVLAVGLVAVQVLPPTGQTYEVGMCLSGQVSSPVGEQVRGPDLQSMVVVPCDQTHQYIVVKIIDPAVTLSSEICPSPNVAFISFETSGLGEKVRHLLGDQPVFAKYACISASG